MICYSTFIILWQTLTLNMYASLNLCLSNDLKNIYALDIYKFLVLTTIVTFPNLIVQGLEIVYAKCLDFEGQQRSFHIAIPLNCMHWSVDTIGI